MNRQLVEDLARELSHRRSLLLQDAAESQDEMKAILQEQESEFEESAQKDRITRLLSRLKERDRQKIREINAALSRMASGHYGKCQKCGRDRNRPAPGPTCNYSVYKLRRRAGKQRTIG